MKLRTLGRSGKYSGVHSDSWARVGKGARNINSFNEHNYAGKVVGITDARGGIENFRR
jgi:hypothetical protein